MAILIKPFTEDLIPAVKAFNLRLEARGIAKDFQFPEDPTPRWLPKVDGRSTYQELFLAVEKELVRGGYIIKHQNFSFRRQIRSVGFYHSPISEGIIDKGYVGVGVRMLLSALQAQPLLFALGMSSYEQPLPRMLKAMGWAMWSVPFYFKVNHPRRFLREIRVLRRTAFRRLALDCAALTGTGWLVLKLLHGVRTAPRARRYSVSVERIKGFSVWSDDLWQTCKEQYAIIALRDCAALNILYPATDDRFVCLRVCRHGKVIGWVVVLNTLMRDDHYFGTLRVGTIVDCLAVPEEASAVVCAAAGALEEMGVDLTISNQAHSAWCRGLRDSGFLPGPSNFIFAASKELSNVLGPAEISKTQVHLNRGDGDGPIHL